MYIYALKINVMKYLKSTPTKTIRLFPFIAVLLIVIFGCNSAKSSSSAKTVKKTEGIVTTKPQSTKKASTNNTNQKSIVNSFSNLDEGELKKLTDTEILQYVKSRNNVERTRSY